MMRNLESCSGNDALMSESDMRRTSRTLPIVLAGSDFMFSGFGSIQRYDNMFGPSNFNAEDIDDFLAMQRDWGVDGGLRTVAAGPDRAAAPRGRAGCAAPSTGTSGWPTSPTTTSSGRSTRPGRRTSARPTRWPWSAPRRPSGDGGLTVVDVVAALDETGYEAEAERILAMIRARLAGDYLQTSAIFDEQLRVLSLVTDPNDYAGPGTGYEPDAARQAEIDAIRQARGVEDLRAEQAELAVPLLRRRAGVPAAAAPARTRARWSSGCRRRSAGTSGAACPG